MLTVVPLQARIVTAAVRSWCGPGSGRRRAGVVLLGLCLGPGGFSAAMAQQLSGQVLVDGTARQVSGAVPAAGSGAVRLRAVPAAERGVHFTHRSGATDNGKRFMIECVGAGLGLIDVDADGDLDLYLVQGGDVDPEGRPLTGELSRDALYLNDGSGAFVDAGPEAGKLGDGFGFGVTAGDIDGDGDEDLLVANLGPNQLLLNDGAGCFSRAPSANGLSGADTDWSMGAAFGDADADGDLDVYVANYFAHDLDHKMLSGKPCRWIGCKVPCGPSGFVAQADRFYVNDGQGRFTELSEPCGLASVDPGFAFQVVFADLDGDADLDLFVANDSVPNSIFVNQGPGADGQPRFEEQGMRSGVALSAMGKEQAGMGVALGDVDGDLLPDMVMTNFSREHNALFVNASMPGLGMMFFDESDSWGIGRPSYFDLGWGATFFDVELDGDLDLFVANGHVYPQVDACQLSQVQYAQHDRLYLQVEPGRFELGPAVADGAALSSRGLAAGDIDADGDIDMVSSTLGGAPVFVFNESRRSGHWLLVDLGPAADAVGAAVTVTSAGSGADGTGAGSPSSMAPQRRAVLRGSSFLCTEDRRLHFGLPGGEPVDIAVTWIDGSVEIHPSVDVDQVLSITRGQAPVR